VALELADDGSGAAAAAVSAMFLPAGAHQETGCWVLDDQRPPEDPVSVRRDLLETWLLTELELLADHARETAGEFGQASLVAQLQLPTHAEYAAALPSVPVELVDEHRDADGWPVGARPISGATVLAPDSTTPTSEPVMVSLAELGEPARLVAIARQLAVDLLEHFGVERTTVLRPDGALDAFGAALQDQQFVHQHTGQLGLPVDSLSPLERRNKYNETLAEARRWLRP